TSAPRQHLHPFPTRRSSDLSRCARFAFIGNSVRGRLSVAFQSIAEPCTLPAARRAFKGDGRRQLNADGVRTPRVRAPRPRRATRDRKSTRLNSSHVAISYAV